MGRQGLSEYLFSRINMVEPYPEKVEPVIEMLDVTAFFPGGKGLWLEDNSEVMPDVLILGHDFSTVNEYEKMRSTRQNEINSPTWREMIKLFNKSGVALDRCFFSNVYMGLRDTESMTGVFPGAKNKEFVGRNMNFLQLQINTIKPEVIITLGKPASINLSLLSEELKSEWSHGEALSVPYIGLKRSVMIENQVYVCIALEHTSMRNQNVKRRRYKNDKGEYAGNEAEIEMLKDAVK